MGRRSRTISLFWIIMLLLLLVLLGFFLYVLMASLPLLLEDLKNSSQQSGAQPGQVVEYPPNDYTAGDIRLVFCPRQNCTLALLSELKQANSSIHCAFYDLDLKEIIEILQQKSESIDVKLVMDNGNQKGLPPLDFVLFDGNQGLMHNKFCIIDNRVVTTGSFNPTFNDAYRNNNNLVIIGSQILAKNYQAEFEELWAGQFGKGAPVLNPAIYINGTRLENYFCPDDNCQQMVKKELAKANSSIYFMTFSFTDDSIGIDLVILHEKGIDIKGIFEKQQLSNYSEYNLLSYQGLDVRIDSNKYFLHHKVFIIDNRTVITGSYNPSRNANENNDENILIIEDGRIANLFLDEFERLWAGNSLSS